MFRSVAGVQWKLLVVGYKVLRRYYDVHTLQ
jgi:hypothetical protein